MFEVPEADEDAGIRREQLGDLGHRVLERLWVPTCARTWPAIATRVDEFAPHTTLGERTAPSRRRGS